MFCCLISHFFHKLTGEMKGRHLNDFDELSLKSTEIIYLHPTEWFDQAALYRQWIEYVERHCKGIAPFEETDVAT